ncbi:MAG TPA: antitoxin Xre/MbcA/ParS toxin-binding domain-containing protein [Parapedobacter sp.]|uniref:type II RES/Xre toxin-antitoxin system antitoxin n=1 Tax=Parapedobacter sp. TaxID=1958893 RepID=UPI002C41C9A3|nr:antitoxin Xre/MbcA/ParS toxin-binding domain-containing protein [Parapedobacter sp.]HWK57978.1 antitoxin Xre/MbcA/ParS toxin-binding domain-containing protein [Parapedobacter sp.]
MTYEKQLDQEIRNIFKEFDTDRYRTLTNDGPTFNELFTDRLMMTTVVQSGISYRFFEKIQHITPFTENEWAVFLELSTKTLNRYKMENRHFKTLHSEKIMELAEVTREGLEIFGHAEQFKQWLHTTNYALGNKKPMDLLKDSYGKELVLRELTHINHGIFV